MTRRKRNDEAARNSSVTASGSPPDEARWLRIAEGLETLERMLLAESDPGRRDVIWNAFAEAKCT